MSELTLELICRSYYLGYQLNNKKDFNKGVSFLGEKIIPGISLAILWYSKIRKANVGARLGQDNDKVDRFGYKEKTIITRKVESKEL